MTNSVKGDLKVFLKTRLPKIKHSMENFCKTIAQKNPSTETLEVELENIFRQHAEIFEKVYQFLRSTEYLFRIGTKSEREHCKIIANHIKHESLSLKFMKITYENKNIPHFGFMFVNNTAKGNLANPKYHYFKEVFIFPSLYLSYIINLHLKFIEILNSYFAFGIGSDAIVDENLNNLLNVLPFKRSSLERKFWPSYKFTERGAKPFIKKVNTLAGVKVTLSFTMPGVYSMGGGLDKKIKKYGQSIPKFERKLIRY